MIDSAVNGIEDALRQCGVTETTLTTGEKDALDRDGYLVTPAAADSTCLEQLRAAFETAMGRGPLAAGGPQSGTRHAADLIDKDPTFIGVCTHPKVLAAVYHVLRRSFGVFQLSGREPLPGYGQQGLHTDWLPRAPAEPFSIVTAIWLLDHFTPNNGATRLIPGSHLLSRPLPKSMTSPTNRHPDQRIVVAGAGSVLVFNGHLWHSGTRNDTDLPRRVLQCQFVARERMRSVQIRTVVPAGLTPAARYILGA